MLNRSRSRAAGARARRHTLAMALIQTLEQRRLFAAPTVEQPPAYPAPGEPVGPDGHFHFENAPSQQVKVAFDQSVTLAADAMSLLNLTTGQTITELTQTDPEPGPTRTWDVGYADPNVWTGVLPRGNYELLLNADRVTSAVGNEKLDGDRDGTGGDDYVSGFFFQPGDVNHDRVVDGADYGTLDQWYQFPGTNGFSNGDVNYDEVIDGADYGTLDAWFGTALPEAPDSPNTMNAAAGREQDGLKRAYIDVTWQAPADMTADGFHIYRSDDAGDTWTLYHTVADPAARSWRDYGAEEQGLADGTKYTYRIRAYNATDLSLTSNKYWTVTNLPGALEAPKASLIGPDGVTLTWNDNTSNETGFEIEQTGPGGVVTIIPMSGGNSGATKEHRVTGLSEASEYTFRVRALTAAQTSVWSPATSVTTLADGAPIGPSHVGGVSGSWWTTMLNWTDNSDNEDGFLIQQWGPNGWFTVDTADANATSYTIDTGLTSATTYTYRVVATNENGSSAGDGSDSSETGSEGGAGDSGGGDGGAGDGATNGDTGANSGSGSSAVSMTTAEAYGAMFSVMSGGESRMQPVQRSWSGAEVSQDGSFLGSTSGGAVTLTLNGLPPHGAIVLTSIYMPGWYAEDADWQIKASGAPLEVVDGKAIVEHSGESVSIEFDPGSYGGTGWSPDFEVAMETPVLSIGGAVITVGETVKVPISAVDHGILSDGYHELWPFDLSLTADVEDSEIVTVQGPITYTAPDTLEGGDGNDTLTGGDGDENLVTLAAAKPGTTTTTIKSEQLGAKSQPTSQTVGPHTINAPGAVIVYTGQETPQEVVATVKNANGLPAVGVTVRGSGGASSVSATTDAQGQAKLKLQSDDFPLGPSNLTLTVDNDPKAKAAVTVIKMSPTVTILPPFGWSVNAVQPDEMTVQVTDPQTAQPLNGVNIVEHHSPWPTATFGQLSVDVLGSSYHPGDSATGGIVEVKLSGSTNDNNGVYDVWFTVAGDPTAASKKVPVNVERVQP